MNPNANILIYIGLAAKRLAPGNDQQLTAKHSFINGDQRLALANFPGDVVFYPLT
ncbi:MAG: hypothetical protein FOGNACKC_02871 [Anaerolineae bacterium]|nr:hypothetical protein [Anaerolineae bacterium]